MAFIRRELSHSDMKVRLRGETERIIKPLSLACTGFDVITGSPLRWNIVNRNTVGILLHTVMESSFR